MGWDNDTDSAIRAATSVPVSRTKPAQLPSVSTATASVSMGRRPPMRRSCVAGNCRGDCHRWDRISALAARPT